MQITLQTVRDVVRAGFGKDSFVAGFIQSVAADPHVSTACIDTHGNMKYNPGFAQDHLQHPENLFCLLVHELCHCLFRHSIHGGGKVENIGEDALINAFITHAFQKVSGHGRLFREFYQETGVEGLLRPNANLRYSRFGLLYARLYGSARNLSSGEVIQSLKVLLEEEEPSPVLLGSHGNADALPDTVKEGLAKDFGDAIDLAAGVGTGNALYGLFLKRLKSVVGIQRAVLRRYTTNQRLDRFVAVCRETRMGVSPVPIAPTKRELIMLHAGMMPPPLPQAGSGGPNEQGRVGGVPGCVRVGGELPAPDSGHSGKA